MNRIKVSEASGIILDWLVENADLRGRLENTEQRASITNRNIRLRHEWSPSVNWAQGGPIIEREKIATSPLTDGTWSAYVANGTRWVPRNQSGVEVYNWEFKQTGSTLLIVAMRCYVTSKLGDLVEVPEELIG